MTLGYNTRNQTFVGKKLIEIRNVQNMTSYCMHFDAAYFQASIFELCCKSRTPELIYDICAGCKLVVILQPSETGFGFYHHTHIACLP